MNITPLDLARFPPRLALGALLAVMGAARTRGAESAPTAATGAAQPGGATEEAPTLTPEQIAELHAAAQSLWDAYAPESLKAEYQFITRDELMAFFGRLEGAGKQEDLAQLAAYAPETRAAIAAMRAQPDFADYADWLQAQLDEMEAAASALKTPPRPHVPPPKPGTPPKPGEVEPPPVAPALNVPLYELWLGRIAGRPKPSRADELSPELEKIFVAEGLPGALVWLAEAESTFNPRAKSPAGARGLFQLMPATAKALGLSLFPSDERTHPELSARAAANLLRRLHARFGDWPLALAAYNAGEGRVARELKAREARDFAGIAEHLPAETRLYVPKVLATVKVRSGVEPAALPAPRR